MATEVTRYEPGGTDHDFQRDVTRLLHEIVVADSRFTLANLGYLHMNTLTYDRKTGNIRLRIYFDLRLATRENKSRYNSGRSVNPVGALEELFRNRLFVGPLANVVTYETVMAPEVEFVEQDERGRPYVKVKKGSKLRQLDVLVVNCHLALTVAGILGINLKDPAFRVRAKVMNDGDGGEVIAMAGKRETPVFLSVEYNSDFGGQYDPADVPGYLAREEEKRRNAERNRAELAKKAKDDATKNRKKRGENPYFKKYS